jgi:hypothetical protein
VLWIGGKVSKRKQWLGLSAMVCSGFLRGVAQNVRIFQHIAHSCQSFNKPSVLFPPDPHKFSTPTRRDEFYQKASKQLRPGFPQNHHTGKKKFENKRRLNTMATVLITVAN